MPTKRRAAPLATSIVRRHDPSAANRMTAPAKTPASKNGNALPTPNARARRSPFAGRASVAATVSTRRSGAADVPRLNTKPYANDPATPGRRSRSSLSVLRRGPKNATPAAADGHERHRERPQAPKRLGEDGADAAGEGAEHGQVQDDPGREGESDQEPGPRSSALGRADRARHAEADGQRAGTDAARRDAREQRHDPHGAVGEAGREPREELLQGHGASSARVGGPAL